MAASSDNEGTHFSILFFVLLLIEIVWSSEEWELVAQDLLSPYSRHHYWGGQSHRHVRDCQPIKFGNVTHEIFPANQAEAGSVTGVDVHPFVTKVGESWEQRNVYGHHIVVEDPTKTVSVEEPGGLGGCKHHRNETTMEVAHRRNCIMAVNAGFYNTHNHACYGNVVSDGVEGHNSGGKQNAHFGIQKDGSLFFGYLAEETLLEEEFDQLVSGVIWLVRSGQKFIETSKVAECSDTQESGTLQRFIDVHSARAAVGHDDQGRLVIVAIDGQTGVQGLNLDEFADMLISMGVVNAINLDGGGSVTMVINGTLANYPGDTCKIKDMETEFRCPRAVSTSICVHEPVCDPADCSKHGDCHSGKCRCHDNWSGVGCDILRCGLTNCSGHGDCKLDGCHCWKGWYGAGCSQSCLPGTYGENCQSKCRCQNRGYCNTVNGACQCQPGYIGTLCDQKCSPGYYGFNCERPCYCMDGCLCHHVTGQCNVTLHDHGQHVWHTTQCLINKKIENEKLVVAHPEQYKAWLISIILMSCIAAGSIILNITLLCTGCTCSCTNLPITRSQPIGKHRRRNHTKYKPAKLVDSLSSSSENDTLMQISNSGHVNS